MKNEFQDTYEQIFSGAYEQLQKVLLLKLHALSVCKGQLKKFKGNLLGKIGLNALNQKNEEKSDEFVVNCYSYEKLYKVRYEALRKHIFGKMQVDDQSE